MRRDSDRLLDEDNFQIILDTFNDSRNGYMFVTTPLGAKLEQQISEEGEGNTRAGPHQRQRQPQLGRHLGRRRADHRRRVDRRDRDSADDAALRRRRGADLGHQFLRTIRRKNEQVFWAPIPKAYTLTRVSLAGRSRPAVAQPGPGPKLSRSSSPARETERRAAARRRRCATSASTRGTASPAGSTSTSRYNTDFAQVEADEQQVNLTRFSLFFPEKRDFFLENAGLFKMGTGGTFTSTTVETDLFFSRRIGLSDSGQPIPIVGGGRLAGKSGRHNVGVLDIQTDSAFGKPGDNFLVSATAATS